ncbi:FUSC family protein [Brachybacterium huguangmaarense]|uniref:FUSC family protein n=1 Tax=Brachybacterium huguangmaarense TaxID=1652028 RepID=A0ABY6G5B3_9MICO|nr:FUSC family protein [Brachybacterium huguangmaarense]UYG17996.1 FUSC family protein [Brachybacterium huguangmaarense]
MTPPLPASRTGSHIADPSAFERARRATGARLRTGLKRSGSATFSIARVAASAAIAYGISHLLWGHQFPFFSAVAAYVVVGFTVEKKMRKMFEMSAGVLLGVLLGEVARVTIGGGVWQIGVMIFVAAMLARFIDSGVMFAMQCGIQSMLVLVMPATPSMTPGSRFLDAVTGVTVAIVIYLLFSGDPRRPQRRAAERFYLELDDTLVSLAVAARTGSEEVATAGLRSLRSNSQKLTDQWDLANDAANEMATFSPTGARHARSVERLRKLLVGSDRAMRNARVIARREAEFLHAVDGDPHSSLADALVAAHDAVTAIRDAIATDDADFTASRRALRIFCSYLTPEILLTNDNGTRPGRAGHFEGVTLVIQLRALATDLLEATGLTHDQAGRFLPSLLITGDGDTIGPRPQTREMSAVEPPATTEALELLITDRSDPDRRR